MAISRMAELFTLDEGLFEILGNAISDYIDRMPIETLVHAAKLDRDGEGIKILFRDFIAAEFGPVLIEYLQDCRVVDFKAERLLDRLDDLWITLGDVVNDDTDCRGGKPTKA